MNLYILRHGIAEELGSRKNLKDADRALTAEGEQKLRKIARAMVKLELSFDLVLSSPLPRAQQTAAIVAEHLELSKAVELSDTLAPSGSTRKLIELLHHLQPSADQILLVGHEPYLSELISLLIFGEKTSSVVMKKAGLCKLSALALSHGRCAQLEWLLTPKQLQFIA